MASIFEEYACPNIVVRRPPFPVAPLMTARFQRAPPARLGPQDCHLRDLLLPLCRSTPLSLVLGSTQILPSLRLEFDFRLLLLLQASCHSALPRVTRLVLHLHQDYSGQPGRLTQYLGRVMPCHYYKGPALSYLGRPLQDSADSNYNSETRRGTSFRLSPSLSYPRSPPQQYWKQINKQ